MMVPPASFMDAPLHRDPCCPVCKGPLHEVKVTVIGLKVAMTGLWCRRCRHLVNTTPPSKGKKP